MTTESTPAQHLPETEEPPPWRPAGAKRKTASDTLEETLKDVRRKIYPRSVTGWFAGWRVMLVVLTQLLYYGLPWLQWNERQAVLFDLGARKFYIFGMVLWPQDVIYLTLLLIISALALFLFTALAGRLFCGYACPQTVYTEIFMWIERKVEGDRVARIRLDESPLSFKKLRVKGTKHLLWIAVAFWTGFTFIGYFAPIRELGANLLAFTLGPWQWFWLLFYSFATWGNAGFLREQVCKYMCPYARFQSVMVDSDTYVVTYDYKRGEPRGPRSKKTDYKAEGLGECVDCSICVQVCPTGIDIRKGLQYMCIGCGACVDACNQVMEKVNYPKGLIRYTSERGIEENLSDTQVRKRLLRPRVLIYSTLMVIIIAVFLGSLATRETLRVDIIRDRGALGREVPGGLIENVYRLQILNASEESLRLSISAEGLPGLNVLSGGGGKQSAIDIRVPAAANLLLPVVVQAPYDAGETGAHPITFVTESRSETGRQTEVREASSFIFPR
ncbi:cytochrome c oxidase accessory protein CcoG [Orrella daihaiensis]|uniref:Cytochrome c oxidase accessory protein CcoG n=1 Tax=Orrella daihaiensis TaxID=2782176 RepID=A0ABY4AT44_9BURK|nr:cytochrome c oxidase accessory protein CcoG [Orrella daihaiensis]UOD51214.1 cytochrome c oxidase accessory protein CcoG [Orrella daihaiensis]